MTLAETFTTDQGELAAAGLDAVIAVLESKGLKLAGDSDDAIHEALWDVLGQVTVAAA